MNNMYPHLLNPIRIGNMVLKNRMTASSSMLYFIQGPEQYPTDAMIKHLANKAKSGASIVTARGIYPRLGKKRVSSGPIMEHMPEFNLYDEHCQNAISHLADAIHYYGSNANMNLGCRIFEGYDVSNGFFPREGEGASKELTEKQLDEIADDYAEQALILKHLGFDMVSLHMAYRHQTPGRFLSPLVNTRTDKYGGSLENRARFPLEVCDRIKKECGQDFPIQVLMSGEEPYEKFFDAFTGTEVTGADHGYTLEDTIKFAKMAEGHFDILQLRYGLIDPAHPIGYELNPRPFLKYAEALKASGTDMIIETVGGYQDPKANEEIIADGKADLIAMARTWISNSDYLEKLEESRPEDITPCIRCNKCHVVNAEGPWTSVCSVNPVMGIEHMVSDMIMPVKNKKTVAVIGGGPAGMEAAIVCADRGHDVVLYEKDDTLGGQMRHSDYVPFKWPLKDFKDYMIKQVEKRPIDIKLGCEAGNNNLKEEGFDYVIAALGAKPMFPKIKGIEKAIPAIYAYADHAKLGEKTVIIGGGEIGVETGIYLAQKGHIVTVIEMTDKLAADSTPLHYRNMVVSAWENEKNFHGITNAKCFSVEKNAVRYFDAQGIEQIIEADGIVIAAGMTPLTNEAMSLYDAGQFLRIIGDCSGGRGSVQRAMRTAFSTANQI